jgi:rod shape determining protein RodA
MPTARGTGYAADVRNSATRQGPVRFDAFLVLSALILLAFGLMSLYSKSSTFDGGSIFRRQLVNALVGLVPFALLATVHPKTWQRGSWLVYSLNALMLLAVLALGKSVKGAERWIDIGPLQFQPSELSKLLTVLTLAAFYANRENLTNRFSTLALAFVHVSVPMGLILLQPHLGAAMVVFVSWLAISVIARVPWGYLVATLVGFTAIAGALAVVPGIGEKVLHGYQAERIQGLVSRNRDTQGRNWQTDRAEIAFGVGGVLGTGFGQGTQKAGRFIPEQHNDFIFTVIGEEGGLVGSSLLLLAYAFFFYRVWLVMLLADDIYYRMIAAGILAVLFFHTFVNLAMVLHLVPVVGLWLPFMSAGGTALWLCMACVGLLLNLRRHERQILF